jgi:hypothetical protein
MTGPEEQSLDSRKSLSKKLGGGGEEITFLLL